MGALVLCSHVFSPLDQDIFEKSSAPGRDAEELTVREDHPMEWRRKDFLMDQTVHTSIGLGVNGFRIEEGDSEESSTWVISVAIL